MKGSLRRRSETTGEGFVKQVGFNPGVKERDGVMDEQSGGSKEEAVMGEGIGDLEMKWYQNEVDEEIKGADSRDKVKHNKRSDQLFLERMMSVVEQE